MLTQEHRIQLMRDTYLEVNLDALARNTRTLKQEIGPDVALCAVVKANAYGMGAAQVAQVLLDNGAELLAVANLLEAVALKRMNAQWPVWVMGHTPEDLIPLAIDHHIMLTLSTWEQGLAVNNYAASVNRVHSVQVKFDTGFNRLGFQDKEKDRQQMIQLLDLPHVAVKGIFSHLALASKEEDCIQKNKLMSLKQMIFERCPQKEIHYHICDSISGIAYPDFRMNMVRVGAALLGSKSYRYPQYPIEDVVTLRTRISHLKAIDIGEGVSYDYKWRANRKTLVATLPFGYADGYPRNVGSQGYVVIRGKKAPLIGAICMDQCLADVTDIMDVCYGDDVVVFGCGGPSVGEVADMAGTNKNNIFASVAHRVPRVYMRSNHIVRIINEMVGEQYDIK